MTKHGAPDWSQYRPGSVTFPVLDLAELAARLGSINTFNRQGDVVFMDNFDDALIHSEITTGGGSAAASISPTVAKSSGYSLKFTCGPDPSNTVFLTKIYHPSATKTIGAEFSFASVPPSTIIELQIVHHLPPTKHVAKLRYNAALSALQYDHPDTGWTALQSGLSLINDTHAWHTMKLVVNFDKNAYLRALLNQYTVDLSTIPLPTAATTQLETFVTTITLGKSVVGEAVMYIDDIILTQDEPHHD